MTEEDTVDRNNWRRKSAVATPDGKSRNKKNLYTDKSGTAAPFTGV